MEKGYKNIVVLFIAITVVVLIGFYNTYFAFFPGFEKFKALHHIHAFVMMLWLAILIVQPMLINKRKYKWHRVVGKFSYFLVPIIIVTMFLAYKNSYLTAELNGEPHAQNLSLIFMPLTDIFPFAAFYILAIINKKNVVKHLRYMISTALVVVIAGLVRIFLISFHFDFMPAIFISSIIVVLIFVSFILYDFRKGMQLKSNPFVTALIVFSIPNILLGFVPKTSIWQSFADGIVKAIF